MNRMNRMDRIKSALNGEPVDRVPISVWMHYPAVDQDPKTLAETQVAFQTKYDLDFIKLMPFGLYSAQDWGCQVKFFCTETEPPVVFRHHIQKAEEWESIEELPPFFGTWGKQLLLTKYTQELTKNKVPYVQTIFSPMTTALKLAGDRVFDDMRSYPALLRKALEAITKTTVNFVRESYNYGISGVFFATQCAVHDLMTWDEYVEFGRAYDLQVLEEANRAGWFNILHVHGANTMFKELLDYPVQALNWHDRQVFPSLRQAREMTQKCLIGGLDESGPISQGKPEQVIAQVFDAIEQTEAKGLMIGPGCVAFPDTPAENIIAARAAVDEYAKKQLPECVLYQQNETKCQVASS